MPLHDWTDDSLWENFHNYWIVKIAETIQPQLPEGYQVYIGSYSRVGLASAVKPDVGVGGPVRMSPPAVGPAAAFEPDEVVAVATVEPETAVYVQYRGMMVAAVEIVSPRNKDRLSDQAASTARYAAYVRGGIHLMLIDLLPRPVGFSLADGVVDELGIPNQPSVRTPFVVVYRVGRPTDTGGSFVGVWRRPLSVGNPLPALPLPLSERTGVTVDLETTYQQAARFAYLA
jgi:hypothetical protein